VTVDHNQIASNPKENGVSVSDGSISPPLNGKIDTDLQAIIDAWPALPEAVKVDIVAIVKAATGGVC